MAQKRFSMTLVAGLDCHLSDKEGFKMAPLKS